MQFLNDIVAPNTYCEITRSDDGYHVLYTVTPNGEKIFGLNVVICAYAEGKTCIHAKLTQYGKEDPANMDIAAKMAERVIHHYQGTFDDPLDVKVIFMKEGATPSAVK